MTHAMASVAVEVTSFFSGPHGGGIAFGRDDDGRQWRIVLARDRAARDPAPAERWRFLGERRAADGVIELTVARALPLLPCGHGIVRYLAQNIVGVGKAYAQRLWDRYGDHLYEILKTRDVAALREVVGPFLAQNIVLGWGLYTDDVDTFAWLDRHGIAPRTAVQLVRLWGAGARRRIVENPYALSLLESWRSVDEAALRAGMLPNDKRRLAAAVEEACARRYLRRHHTASTRAELLAELQTVLPDVTDIDAAITIALDSRRLLHSDADLLQSRGPHEMERFVRRALTDRNVPAVEIASAQLAQALNDAERSMGHALTNQQRHAVQQALQSPVSVLCGGAGTGKTATLRAVLLAAKHCLGRDYPIHQVALAGRAAKRIAEATGFEATTVYRFLLDVRLRWRSACSGMLVIDEASMLDLPTVYSLLRAISPKVRLLFVGDPAQLPPIGPGLVFHRLVLSTRIPRVELTSIKRQQHDTGIPQAGASIRSGRWPHFRAFDFAAPLERGVFFLDACDDDVTAAACRALGAMAGPNVAAGVREHDIQLLCATKRGAAGSAELNETIERANIATDQLSPHWGLGHGSKVLWVVNDHQRGTRTEPRSLLNGTLGFVSRTDSLGAVTFFDDGSQDVLRRDDLRKLDRGWAISIHKAQGSAFRHVIVPVVASRLLDRTLVYTALTRAITSVVFVGSRELLRQAITREASVVLRRIGSTMLSL